MHPARSLQYPGTVLGACPDAITLKIVLQQENLAAAAVLVLKVKRESLNLVTESSILHAEVIDRLQAMDGMVEDLVERY